MSELNHERKTSAGRGEGEHTGGEVAHTQTGRGMAAPAHSTTAATATPARNAMARRARRIRLTWMVLAALCMTSVLLSLLLGQYTLSPGAIWQAISEGPSASGSAASILWNVRMPRIVLAVLVGSSLAVGGALMQALFSNPLAEPGIIGVSSGSAVGAALAIVSGAGAASVFAVPTAAFVTGLGTTLLVYHLASARGSARAAALVLTGVAVNAAAGALISAAVYIAPTTARDQIVFWQMGSLNAASWLQVGTIVPLCLLGIAACCVLAPRLDILSLGERAARQVGLNTTHLRFTVIVLTALLTAAAVAFAGIITFVGLIVPHVLRLIIGPSNRVLVPLSALGGAFLVSIADLAARTTVPFSDLPIGIFTALVGAPTFFLLLRATILKGGRP